MPTSVPTRILVAPSGFKESLSPEGVCQAVAAGVRRLLPGAVVVELPLVDGGEGSAATMARATGGDLVTTRVTGPVGEPVDSYLARLGGSAQGTWLVEMAAAAGLRLVPAGMRDPGATTTIGVGELISVALDGGARRIIIGCGDSGTCDGGAGALVALGARLLDVDGHEVDPIGSNLARVQRIETSGMDHRLRGVEVLVAARPVSAGTVLTEADLERRTVPAGAAPEEGLAGDEVVGARATIALETGTVLTTSMTSAALTADLSPAERVVQVPVDVGAELAVPGARVDLVAPPAGGVGDPIAGGDAVVGSGARVLLRQTEETDNSWTSGTKVTLITLAVPAEQATLIVAAAARGSLGIILSP